MEAINYICTHRTQVALGVEKTPAVDAIVMRLTVVFVLAMGGFKEPVTSVAVVVLVEAVCDELVIVIKVVATLATIVMPGTLDIVLFEGHLRVKVLITTTAIVVIRRVQEVLAV